MRGLPTHEHTHEPFAERRGHTRRMKAPNEHKPRLMDLEAEAARRDTPWLDQLLGLLARFASWCRRM